MGRIAENLDFIRRTIPSGVDLVAVSKFQPVESILEAYEAGQRLFAESRVAELQLKAQALPKDIQWHFIGHIQTNKLSSLTGLPALIESVDSERLLELIDKKYSERGLSAKVLLEVRVAREETKYGFTPDDILSYFSERRFESLRATHICGLMAMASNTDDQEVIRSEFKSVASLMGQIRNLARDLRGFDRLSMGMSDDYLVAIAEGSNIVRIGSAIFGERPAKV